MTESGRSGARRLLLNGEWEFTEGPDGPPPGDRWQRLRVPHRSREFEGDPPEQGWYRTSVRAPKDWIRGHRLVLQLERVRHFGRLYVDGQPVSEHRHLRLPWEVDLTDALADGNEHELLLFLHSCQGEFAHPSDAELSEAAMAALDTRFWFTSAPTVGIEGDVWLQARPELRIEEVCITTSVRQMSVSAEVTVRNETGAPWEGSLHLQVLRQGHSCLEIPAQTVCVEADATAVAVVTVPWPDPVLWGRPPYGEPFLYFLRATLASSGAAFPEHETHTRFGFREIWAEGDRLLLNGEQLVLWGDHSTPYVYERQWLTRKFHDLVDANISIVEHHRYDAPDVFYDVADEMGIFVVASNFCVGTGQVPSGLAQDELDLVLDNHVAVLDAWVRRTRNHPSILFWDVTDAREPAFCVPLLRRARELDPSRILEVTFDHEVADTELIDLIDCYRLFSSLEHIEAAIAAVRTDPRFPVKPVRVGEAGIFSRQRDNPGVWGADEEPPLMDGWWDFLTSMPSRNIHGLQTFYLTDMDYRGFTHVVPGSLAAPLDIEVAWPSQSGLDARIDPHDQGTPAAWGKAALYLNWCDPRQPVSLPTRTKAWSQDLFRRLAGRDVGPLAAERLPEVLVQIRRGDGPASEALVLVEPLEGQAMAPWGMGADAAGTGWFYLPEPGRYRFTCEGESAEVGARCHPVKAPPGYDHVHQVEIVLPGKG